MRATGFTVYGNTLQFRSKMRYGVRGWKGEGGGGWRGRGQNVALKE